MPVEEEEEKEKLKELKKGKQGEQQENRDRPKERCRDELNEGQEGEEDKKGNGYADRTEKSARQRSVVKRKKNLERKNQNGESEK